MTRQQVLVAVVGSGFLVVAGSIIKLGSDVMFEKPIKVAYATIRITLSFIAGVLIGRGAIIMGYQPFQQITPFAVLILVGIGLDKILKDAPAKSYQVLQNIFRLQDSKKKIE